MFWIVKIMVALSTKIKVILRGILTIKMNKRSHMRCNEQGKLSGPFNVPPIQVSSMSPPSLPIPPWDPIAQTLGRENWCGYPEGSLTPFNLHGLSVGTLCAKFK